MYVFYERKWTETVRGLRFHGDRNVACLLACDAMLSCRLLLIHAMNMYTIRSAETLVTVCKTARYHDPVDRNRLKPIKIVVINRKYKPVWRSIQFFRCICWFHAAMVCG